MNTLADHIAEICKVYNLGQPLNNIERVPGGLLHQLYYVRTERGEYAIKCMENNVLKNLQHTLLTPEQTQQITQYMFQRSIPTVVALKHNHHFTLNLGLNTYLVMPWIKGEVLQSSEITPSMTRLVGQCLRKVQIDASLLPDFAPLSCLVSAPDSSAPSSLVSAPDSSPPSSRDLFAGSRLEKLNSHFPLPHWIGHKKNEWQTLLRPYCGISSPIIEKLNAALVNLTQWSEQARSVQTNLNHELVLSHRDFDPKNVVWQARDHPILLDWEYAGLINPKLDLFIVALNWSEVTSGNIHTDKFNSVIEGYSNSQQESVSFPFEIIAGYKGYCLDWLAYNLQRLNSSPLAENEIAKTLNAIYAVEEIYN